MSEFHQYEAMRDAGLSPDQVYHLAVEDGLDEISCIRLLRSVFALSLVDAKKAMVRSSGKAASLADHQEKLLPALKRALQNEAEREKREER